MRVVAGKYRGRKLKEFDLSTTKPTLDRVKESIFNLIQFDIVDSVVLDLFSGTGSLGIEAISRGAKKTYLVDSNIEAIKIIKNNIKNIDAEFEIIHEDYIKFLNSTKEKFDIVLLDPPYNSDFGKNAIELLIKNKMLTENAIIIFETNMDNELVYHNFKTIKKKYGSVIVYKLVKE